MNTYPSIDEPDIDKLARNERVRKMVIYSTETEAVDTRVASISLVINRYGTLAMPFRPYTIALQSLNVKCLFQQTDSF